MKLKLFKKGLYACKCNSIFSVPIPACDTYIIIKDDMQIDRDCDERSDFYWWLWRSNTVVVRSGKLWAGDDPLDCSCFHHAWHWRDYAKRLA